MDKESFLTQVQRLRETYGEKAYPPSRADVFWRAFSRYSEDVFADAVTQVIGEEQYAPMIDKLGEAVTEAQNRTRRNLRAAGEGTLQAALDRTPEQEAKSRELAAFCLKFINGLLAHKVNAEDAKAADALLDGWIRGLRKERGEPERCARCDGSGYATNIRPSGNREACRCDCPIGLSKPEYLEYLGGVRVRFLTYSEAKKSTARFS